MKFTPEMFPDLDRPALAAIHAQYAFDKWLEEQPVVYAKSASADLWDKIDARPRDTHTARLVNIKEIGK